MASLSVSAITYALIGGIVPALLWLWFWLREDKLHPEPRRYVILTFFLGMLAVPLVIPFEQWALTAFGAGTVLVISWALIEEVFKYLAAYVGGLGRSVDNEPIDPMIYLITAALGFAALENAFFILTPLVNGNIALTFLTGNIRFVGATLLHVLASGTIGAFLAFSFYSRKVIKQEHAIFGLISAIGLHALFNYFILLGTKLSSILTFAMIWVAVIILLFVFERVKRIRRG